MTDGAKVDIDLSGLNTIQDVLSAFNQASPELTASINTTGTGINLSDTAGGGGNISVINMNGSSAGADLGIVGTATGNVLHGAAIVTGFRKPSTAATRLIPFTEAPEPIPSRAAAARPPSSARARTIRSSRRGATTATTSYTQQQRADDHDDASGVAAVGQPDRRTARDADGGQRRTTPWTRPPSPAGSVILTVGDGKATPLKAARQERTTSSMRATAATTA